MAIGSDRVPSAMALRNLLRLPATDPFHGLDHCLDRGWRGLLLAALGLAAGWWVYVPLHELLHALACEAAGGEVTRLEIAEAYGGALLAHIFPFVTAGSEYAGRLSGFDTGGNDWIYLATDLGPFLLTLVPGVWWLRRAARSRRALLFGASLPFALAPFLSLTGDAYEIGSLLVTNLPPWQHHPELLGDDVFRKAEELSAAGPGAPWGGATLAMAAGVVWAFLVYGAGDWLARRAGQAPLAPLAPREAP